MMNFTLSGLALKSMLQITALRKTLFPEPVVPATRRCGILTRSDITGTPTISSPRAIGSWYFDSRNSSLSRTSFKCTGSLSLFGISMPITAFPGTGAIILTRGDLRANARSSERLTILFIFTPGASSSSYMVITGPGLTSTTFPSTPKSDNFFSRILEFIMRLSFLILTSLRFTSSRRESGGSWKVPLDVRNSKDVCSNLFLRSLSAAVITGASSVFLFFFALETFFCLLNRSILITMKVFSQTNTPLTNFIIPLIRDIRDRLIVIIMDTIRIRHRSIYVPTWFRYELKNVEKKVPRRPPEAIFVPNRWISGYLIAESTDVENMRPIKPGMTRNPNLKILFRKKLKEVMIRTIGSQKAPIPVNLIKISAV